MSAKSESVLPSCRVMTCVKTGSFSVWNISDSHIPQSTLSEVEATNEEEEEEEEAVRYLLPMQASSALFGSVSTLNLVAARTASLHERKVLGKEREGTLTYGEVTHESVWRILQRIEELGIGAQARLKGGEFVDLGSGAGCPAIAAACCFPFSRCIGIEILEGLHDLAVKSQAEYAEMSSVAFPYTKPEVTFFKGDIFDTTVYDWRHAALVLANSTCFSKDMFSSLADMSRSMLPGSIFVTLTYALPSELYTVVTTDRLPMSWGEADVYYSVRNENENL